jgi:hypothetical protein
VIGFGLTDENWRHLRLGQPILVKLREMIDSDLEILLIGGETEYTLTEQLAPMIGPSTVVHRDLTPPGGQSTAGGSLGRTPGGASGA